MTANFGWHYPPGTVQLPGEGDCEQCGDKGYVDMPDGYGITAVPCTDCIERWSEPDPDRKRDEREER